MRQTPTSDRLQNIARNEKRILRYDLAAIAVFASSLVAVVAAAM